MEMTQQQKDEVKQVYALRRKRQMMVTLPVFIAAIAVAVMEDQFKASSFVAAHKNVLIGAMFGTVIAVIMFSLKNWRCPACNRYLRKTYNPKYCPGCGVELR